MEDNLCFQTLNYFSHPLVIHTIHKQSDNMKKRMNVMKVAVVIEEKRVNTGQNMEERMIRNK